MLRLHHDRLSLFSRGISLGLLGSLCLSVPALAQGRSFQTWCQERDRLSEAQQLTVEALLAQAGTTDCGPASQLLENYPGVLVLINQGLTDITPLSSLPNLKGLDLSFNQVRDLRPLQGLTQLQFLLLAGNQVTDVSPLAGMTQMGYLVLDNNRIENLSPLATLTNLNSLQAMANPLRQKVCPVEPTTTCIFSDDGADRFAAGEDFFDQGQFQAAFTAFQDALQIYQDGQDQQRVGDALQRMADSALNLGQFARSLSLSEQALALRQQLQDFPGVGLSLIRLGEAYDRLGQYDQAEDYLEQALANLAEQERSGGIPLEGGIYKLPLDQAVLYNQLAVLQNKKGDSEAARRSIEKSLELYQIIPDEYPAKRGGERRSLDTQGVTYTRLGLVQAGIASLEQSLELSRSLQDFSGEATALSHLGDAYRAQNDRAQALEFYRQALAIYDRTGNQPGAGLTWHNLGDTLVELQRWSEATDALLKSVEIWETLRPGLTDESKVALFETQSVTYERLQEALVEQNKIEAALAVSEQGRARAFVELLANRLGGQTSEQFQQLAPPRIEDIRRLAQEQQATLVEYSILSSPKGDDRLLIWVIQPNGVVNLRTTALSAEQNSSGENGGNSPSRGLRITRPVETLVVATREQTTQGVTAFAPQGNLSLSEQLRRQQLEANYQRSADLLIAPIADLLPQETGARLILVPHRSLFLIPFAALPTASGKRLIEEYTISVVPALQVLQLQQGDARSAQFAPRRPLIVGNPTMPALPPELGSVPVPLSPLPGAGTEAKTIAEILKTTPLIEDEALESTIVKQMPQADLIHLATHGLIDELQYLDMVVPGAIALAPEVEYQGDFSAPDGLLTANEILDLDLQADLVVLSACNTGKGNITGDGVIGLSRSFMAAGVPNVIVSLWAVPDAPTADLMVAFYNALQQNPDKAAALRQAMLSTMKIYDDPTDWAAFVLMGNAL
ncbi:MAG: hypothetical protein RLZZ435_2971 [Cyanobacteriota bacterium]